MLQLQCDVHVGEAARQAHDVCWRFPQPRAVCFPGVFAPPDHSGGRQIHRDQRLSHRLQSKGIKDCLFF